MCIGEYLSLVELECAFRGLFTRLPNLKVGCSAVFCYRGILLSFFTVWKQGGEHACQSLVPLSAHGSRQPWHPVTAWHANLASLVLRVPARLLAAPCSVMIRLSARDHRSDCDCHAQTVGS